ncbi:MAG: alpha-ketoacid dehydrogenase subunit beta [Chloroflexi bacterium]|nr:MAG: alpha-ketoacid dehydrogenase subunit beta [Chloroflexota bacterium]
MAEVTYLQAIRAALWEEMEADERVFLLGEDIGTYGGVYRVTEGFLEHFGEDRVIDTPIAETAIIGAAIGAALMGMRPVAEIQFADFIACGFDQLVNMAAKIYYRWRAPVPMVVRAPAGATWASAGPFHSQSPEAWFAHVPGLKVVIPSTPYDAKGLLKAAIRDPNPVVYLEQKYLYRRLKQDLPEEDYIVPLGTAHIKRPGSDLSLICYGSMVQMALQAAEEVAADGIDAEVVDVRTLVPLDEETILESARKTSKVVVIQEAPRTAGFGAEIAARIAEKAFEWLDGPVLRVTAPDTPIPSHPILEREYLPDAHKIADVVRELAAY